MTTGVLWCSSRVALRLALASLFFDGCHILKLSHIRMWYLMRPSDGPGRCQVKRPGEINGTYWRGVYYFRFFS
jgi:hypothetical protein